MSQAEQAAIPPVEVTNVESAAQEIERRMDAAEQPQEESNLPEPTDDEAIEEPEQNLNPDDESESSDEETDELEQESEDQEPDAEEGENLTYQNVNELAEALEMSPEDFLENIKITRKIDGVEEEVTLAELRNGNQRDADYRRKTTELADNRKAFEGEIEQAKAKLGQQYQEVAAMTTNLEQQLMGEFQSIDWNALELEDREEWLVKRQKFGERQQQIEAIKNQTGQQLSAQQAEIQAKQQEQQQAHLANQNELLLTAIPEWSDTSVRESEAKEMSQFLGEYGFNEAEVGLVIDHRLVKLARDAMKNKGKTSQIDTAKKLVRKLPKIVRPGSKPDKGLVESKKKQDAKNHLKKHGNDINAVAKYLEDRM